MTRYYFNAANGSGAVQDEEGKELPDLRAARDIAIEAARALMSADLRSGYLDLGGRIEILDETGVLLDVVEFARAIEIKNAGPEASGTA